MSILREHRWPVSSTRALRVYDLSRLRDPCRDLNRRSFENAFRRDAAQNRLEVLKVDRLDHVMGESAIEGTGNILGHAKTAQGNPGQRLNQFRALDQLVTGSIGKSDVAEQNVD